MAATWAIDAYDFYKPAGLWPVVAGGVSVATYLRGLDATYAGVMAKLDAAKRRAGGGGASSSSSSRPPAPSSLADVDHIVLHAPYGKLLRKAFARLPAADARRAAAAAAGRPPPGPGPGEGYDEKQAVADTEAAFEGVVGPSAWLAKNVGNMYTASLFASLLALVEDRGTALDGTRILLYAFGSGAVASLFSVRARAGSGRFTLAALAASLTMRQRLASRRKAPPAELAACLALAEARWCAAGWAPAAGSTRVEPGAFYLVGVDAAWRRSYARAPGGEGGGGGGGAPLAVRAPPPRGDSPRAATPAAAAADLESVLSAG